MIDYGHGDDSFKYEQITFKANFSSNVWYEGAPKSLLAFLEQHLPSIQNYPDPNAENLANLIVSHFNLPESSCIINNGATEAFYLIANTFHGGSATVCTPTFSEYEQACIANNIKIEFIDRKQAHLHDYKTPVAFICNPNNPDGFTNTKEEVTQMAKNNPDTFFIIDEAYTEFSGDPISCTSLIHDTSNVILVKSLTKLFCIPGLRLGYIVANPSITSKLAKHKMPWNINTLAIQAGEFVFKNYEKLVPDFNTHLKEVEKLKEEISKLEGFDVLPTTTSYFLVKLSKPKASQLKSYLANQHQLLIRNASNFRTLDEHYIRIAGQTKEKNQLLIHALKQWKS